MKTSIITLLILFLNLSGFSQEVRTVNRPDGITMKYFDPTPVVISDEYEVGLSLYKNITNDLNMLSVDTSNKTITKDPERSNSGSWSSSSNDQNADLHKSKLLKTGGYTNYGDEGFHTKDTKEELSKYDSDLQNLNIQKTDTSKFRGYTNFGVEGSQSYGKNINNDDYLNTGFNYLSDWDDNKIRAGGQKSRDDQILMLIIAVIVVGVIWLVIDIFKNKKGDEERYRLARGTKIEKRVTPEKETNQEELSISDVLKSILRNNRGLVGETTRVLTEYYFNPINYKYSDFDNPRDNLIDYRNSLLQIMGQIEGLTSIEKETLSDLSREDIPFIFTIFSCIECFPQKEIREGLKDNLGIVYSVAVEEHIKKAKELRENPVFEDFEMTLEQEGFLRQILEARFTLD